MWQSSPGLDSRCAKPCQCEIVSEEIQERKNYRECSNIKARVSVHWRAQCNAKLTFKPWVRIHRKNGICPVTSHNSSHLTTDFCVQDCRSRIAQVEYEGQTRSKWFERCFLLFFFFHGSSNGRGPTFDSDFQVCKNAASPCWHTTTRVTSPHFSCRTGVIGSTGNCHLLRHLLHK